MDIDTSERAAEWFEDEVYLSMPRPGGDAWLMHRARHRRDPLRAHGSRRHFISQRPAQGPQRGPDVAIRPMQVCLS
jgi:hypothetical protein